MKKEFCPYLISLELKKLGFNDWCLAYQNTELIIYDDYEYSKNSQFIGETVAVPLWQQVFDWLREKKSMEIEISKSVIHFYVDEVLQPPKYQYIIDKNGYNDDYVYHSADYDTWFNDYYEARENSVLKALELLNDKQ